jgi:nitrite reductase/ring-hydroxylating ferredoxin subunit/uncharacterized membrane protein
VNLSLRHLGELAEGVEAFDRVAEPLTEVVQGAIPRGAVKDALSGTWLGHPLHPILTDVTIGAWTAAAMLDVVGGTGSRKAADRLIAIGMASALPTATTGLSDWADLYGPAKRAGVAHAASNSVALALMASSYVARKRGRRARGKALSLLAVGATVVGGYLGGHLSYRLGAGVNENAFAGEGPEDWVPVREADDLVDGQPVVADVDGIAVLLVRRGARVFAIADRCSHEGGPLHEGEIDGDCVTCPWHQSTFDLETGDAVHGPATAPQRAFDVRVNDGKIELRRR